MKVFFAFRISPPSVARLAATTNNNTAETKRTHLLLDPRLFLLRLRALLRVIVRLVVHAL